VVEWELPESRTRIDRSWLKGFEGSVVFKFSLASTFMLTCLFLPFPFSFCPVTNSVLRWRYYSRQCHAVCC
jgi:hypothetical protein